MNLSIRLIITLLLAIYSTSCQKSSKESTANNELDDKKLEKTIKEDSDNNSKSKRINEQLRLIDGFTLIDQAKGITLFNFKPYVGEVDIIYTNDSTLTLRGRTQLPDKYEKYKEYTPIILVIKYTTNGYIAFRDKNNETLPKLDKDDLDRIINKISILKNDTTVTKVQFIDEEVERTEEELQSLNKQINESEKKILGYDAELTVAILNGCEECKGIFTKDWPNILGENLIGVIAEQHGWNEELIKEYERPIPR